jgi:predicted amidohydrolase
MQPMPIYVQAAVMIKSSLDSLKTKSPMKLNLTLLATASMFALSVSSAVAQDQSSDTSTVLTAERMFDARTGRMIPSPVVLIRGERIVSVQSGGAIPAGASKVVNLPGMTLLPGLIDMHTHIDSDPSYGGYRSLCPMPCVHCRPASPPSAMSVPTPGTTLV